MTGTKRRFGITRRPHGEQVAEDFAAVFAGDLVSRPSVPLDLPIDSIEASPHQARVRFDDLAELAEAIRVHGFTSRIRVRPHPAIADRYQLVFGERRLRAARAAGLITVPADVAEHTDDEVREIGLTENLLRRDLSPLEEGRAFVAALDAGYSVRKLSERIGKSGTGYVENRVAAARAPQDVQAMVEQRPDTISAARQIVQLTSEGERRPVIEALLAGTVTLSDVSTLVREQRTRAVEHPTDPEWPANPADAPALPASRSVVLDDSAEPIPPGGDVPARRLRAERRSQQRIEGEIVHVLTVIGRWRETGVDNDLERTVLGRGIARILAELEVLLRELEDGGTQES